MDSSRGVALLLLQVKQIANNEVQGSDKNEDEGPNVIPFLSDSVTESYSDSFSDHTAESPRFISPEIRLRTVSLCSSDLDLPGQTSDNVLPGNNVSCLSLTPPKRSSPELTEKNSAAESHEKKQSAALFASHQVNNTHPLMPTLFVGMQVQEEVKGILRKKFSWKTFPKLEAYLINHRSLYLNFSSQRNYTAEQKRFNNKLTQGLLDLAAKEGYIFEGFTFANLRDRIRCYYKSYVQAVKKRKRKKMRH